MVPNPAHPAHRDSNTRFAISRDSPTATPSQIIEAWGMSFTALGLYARMQADPDRDYSAAELAGTFTEPAHEIVSALLELHRRELIDQVQ